jgi:hypothetical protein
LEKKIFLLRVSNEERKTQKKMAGASTLLGLKFANPTDDPEKSKDEQDLRERSTKKKKE